MSNKPETSADITAEIRARAGAWPEPALTKYDMTLADRIDAAVKRECIEAATRAATQGVKLTNEKYANMPIGNTAAMHERVATALEALDLFGNVGDGRIHFCDIARIGIAKAELRKILEEPLRNCDLYATLDDARDAFLKIEELPEGNDDGQMREWFRRFAKWSYLLVAQKKGGAK